MAGFAYLSYDDFKAMIDNIFKFNLKRHLIFIYYDITIYIDIMRINI